MARLIIRTSINGPSPNNKQGELRKVLESHGAGRIGTGVYEGDFASEDDAYDTIVAALDYLHSLPLGFRLDHLWIYVDEVDAL